MCGGGGDSVCVGGGIVCVWGGGGDSVCVCVCVCMGGGGDGTVKRWPE